MKHIGLSVRVAVLPIWLASGVSARGVDKGTSKDVECFLEVVIRCLTRWDNKGSPVWYVGEMNRRIGQL